MSEHAPRPGRDTGHVTHVSRDGHAAESHQRQLHWVFRGQRAAAAAFVRIAQRPSHLKFADTIPWVGKLAEEEPSLVRAPRFYADDAIEKFNNQNQRDVYFTLAFLFGRERFERKEWASAIALLGHVDPSSPYHARAQECIAAAKSR